MARGTTGGVDGITSFPHTSYERSYIHAWSGTGTRSYGGAHLRDRRVCNTCLYPSSGSDGVRACQTDDEKELVHSRYPREVEGTRAGRWRWKQAGRTRERGWNESRDREQEQEQEQVQRQELEGGRKRTRQTERGRQRAGCRFTTSVCASLAKGGGRSYKRVVHPHGRMKGGGRVVVGWMVGPRHCRKGGG